ncbi:hypothetical protein FDA09_16795 [Clostridium botulinum]|uniref:hypothetical protein n=1 Tax=Clostridium botulinum TaxID=1491 RepID=UPI00077323B4|nr:hypothetical protein [Clostridium botulinum]NFH81773.1 hypothetical protein [Clostridium botulinum]NFH85054.1 hypothetical protein [Clostridium botulinum]NFI13004.1 hypothetical protein [Clostridium botulinum]NFI16259.1 hypothetical protein [Clostridium botulinum]NFO86027.1 hypothetical protein [Clostridium botulinum]
MLMPKDFNETQGFTGFQALEAGGHICKIMKVEETKSKAGRDMVVIYLDTDKTDVQPNYYSNAYKNDTRAEKKWNNNAIVRQLVLDAEGATNRGFKTFIDMVEKSNNGFKVAWGEHFADCFKGKLVGALFCREEYLDNAGVSKFATKFQVFRTVEEIKKGVDVPKDKLLNPSGIQNVDDLVEIVDDGDMPF